MHVPELSFPWTVSAEVVQAAVACLPTLQVAHALQEVSLWVDPVRNWPVAHVTHAPVSALESPVETHAVDAY